MAALKYSRQRASIREYLAETREHPTADTVYLHVREEYPNISLGTVYRNLNLLADMGEAIKITTPGGGDRFDGRTDPHCHVICDICKSIFDLDFPADQVHSINEAAGRYFDGKITSHSILFSGICPHCMEKKEKTD